MTPKIVNDSSRSGIFGKSSYQNTSIFFLIGCPNGTFWHLLSPCLNGARNERE
jgi:hypothetical protein